MPRSYDSPDSAGLPSHTDTSETTPDDLDQLFACFATHRRRVLLDYLVTQSEPVVIEDAVQYLVEVEHDATADTNAETLAEQIEISLVHSHFPKLDDAGLIDVDARTQTITPGDQFDLALALADAI